MFPSETPMAIVQGFGISMLFYLVLCLCGCSLSRQRLPPILYDRHHRGSPGGLRKCISSDTDKVRKCRHNGSRFHRLLVFLTVKVDPSHRFPPNNSN